MKKLLGFLLLTTVMAAGQSTSTIVGVIKDLGQNVIPSGQGTFTLSMGRDSAISGQARLSGSTVTCQFNQTVGASSFPSLTRSSGTVTATFLAAHSYQVGDSLQLANWPDPNYNGTVTVATVPSPTTLTYSQAGSNGNVAPSNSSTISSWRGPSGGACLLTYNTALSPANSYYTACLWPGGTKSSCFTFYAFQPTIDLSTVTVTPGLSPNYGNFVDVGSNQTIGGNKTFSGTVTVGGPTLFSGGISSTTGQNTLNFYQANGIAWVGNGAPYKYTTIEGAMAGPECSANGCRIVMVTGFSETNTAQIDIGSATQVIVLESQPDVQLTCNVTSGGSSACWNIHNGSAISGPQDGVLGAGRTGGLHLKYACTAKTAYGINTPEGVAGIGQYMKLDHINFEGCNTGTVAGGGSPSIAAINIEGVQLMSDINNDSVFQFANTIEWRFASNNAGSQGVWGPHIFTNIWSNCDFNTGCQNMKAIATGGPSTLLNFNLSGGAQVAPGPGLPILEINGNAAATFALRGCSVTGTYFENLTANGGSIAIKLVDVLGCVISAATSNMQPVDTFVDISESATGRSRNIHIQGTTSISSGVAYPQVNNHVTGENVTGTFITTYNFGGENAAGVSPFFLDDNNLSLIDTSLLHIYHSIDSTIANYSRLYVDPTGASVVIGTQHAGTGASEGLVLNSDSGNITTQNAGVNEWQFSGTSLKCVAAACSLAPNSNGHNLISGTAPTISPSSGFNTGAITSSNGPSSIVVTVGTGTAGATGTLSLPIASTGWVCHFDNQSRADLIAQTANSTTSVTLTNYGTTFAATNFTNSDVLVGSCFAN